MKKLKCFGIIVLIAIMLIMQTGCPQPIDSTDTEKKIVSVWKSELSQTLTLYSNNTFFLDEGDTAMVGNPISVNVSLSSTTLDISMLDEPAISGKTTTFTAPRNRKSSYV